MPKRTETSCNSQCHALLHFTSVVTQQNSGSSYSKAKFLWLFFLNFCTRSSWISALVLSEFLHLFTAYSALYLAALLIPVFKRNFFITCQIRINWILWPWCIFVVILCPSLEYGCKMWKISELHSKALECAQLCACKSMWDSSLTTFNHRLWTGLG